MNEIAGYAFTWVDYVIIGVIVLSTLISLMRGFISEALSLLTWIVAAVAAFKSAGPIGNLLSRFVHTPTLRLIIGFAIVFIIIIIIGSLINHVISIFISSNGLSGTNRLLGMIFGFARGVLLIAIFVLFAEMTSMIRTPWWHDAQLIPYFQNIAAWLQQFIPVHLNNMAHYFTPPAKGGTS